MFKRAMFASAIVFAGASAHAVTLLQEGFDNVPGLTAKGWALSNLSTPVGNTDWFQGDPGILTAFAGAANSYAAANFNSAAPGGTIDLVMASPAFSTVMAGTATFFARAEVAAPFFDQLRYGISTTDGGPVTFNTVTLTSTWTAYTVAFPASGNASLGRLVINYAGSADTSNYIGVDSVLVSAVPEPGTWLLMGAGLLALSLRRGRASSASASV